MDRLDQAAQAMAGLRDVVEAEEPLDEALHQVAVGATQVIPDADAVTVTVLNGREPSTVAWTDDRYLDIDKQQYAGGRGPCLVAASTQRPVRASTVEHRLDWPEFSAAAEQTGVGAYLAVPLLLAAVGRKAEWVGALNLYSLNPDGFDTFDEGLMRVFSLAAAQSINNARRWQQSREHIRNLETALESRAEIDQAKGILMGAYRCSAQEAFEKLVEQSQRRNVKLRQVALDLLASVSRTPH